MYIDVQIVGRGIDGVEFFGGGDGLGICGDCEREEEQEFDSHGQRMIAGKDGYGNYRYQKRRDKLLLDSGRIMPRELFFPAPFDSIVQGLRQHRTCFAENRATRLWAKGTPAHRRTSAKILSIEGHKRSAKAVPVAAQTLRARAPHTYKTLRL